MNNQQTIDAAITKCHQAWIKQIEAYNRKEGKHYTELDLGPYAKHYAGLAYRPSHTSPVPSTSTPS